MKWLALSLLVLNLLLAVFFIGRDHLPTPSVSDQRAPLNVERLSLRSQAASRPATPAQVADVAGAFCVEWRGLTLPELERAREQLKAVVSERVMSFTEVPVNTRYWVIFPPLPSAESATLKMSEFTAAGLEEVFVVTDGAWRNAISLGLYAGEETARRRMREAESKGVLGTRIEQQPRQGTDFYFVIRSEDDDALKNLYELKSAYPNSQLTRVACQIP